MIPVTFQSQKVLENTHSRSMDSFATPYSSIAHMHTKHIAMKHNHFWRLNSVSVHRSISIYLMSTWHHSCNEWSQVSLFFTTLLFPSMQTKEQGRPGMRLGYIHTCCSSSLHEPFIGEPRGHMVRMTWCISKAINEWTRHCPKTASQIWCTNATIFCMWFAFVDIRNAYNITIEALQQLWSMGPGVDLSGCGYEQKLHFNIEVEPMQVSELPLQQ